MLLRAANMSRTRGTVQARVLLRWYSAQRVRASLACANPLLSQAVDRRCKPLVDEEDFWTSAARLMRNPLLRYRFSCGLTLSRPPERRQTLGDHTRGNSITATSSHYQSHFSGIVNAVRRAKNQAIREMSYSAGIRPVHS